MRDHTKLRVFELANEMAMMIYQVTKNIPKEEVCELSFQIRCFNQGITQNLTAYNPTA